MKPEKKSSAYIFRDARLTLSQLWSFKVSRAKFLDYIDFADLLILKRENC